LKAIGSTGFIIVVADLVPSVAALVAVDLTLSIEGRIFVISIDYHFSMIVQL
jgi:hypothetical protein